MEVSYEMMVIVQPLAVQQMTCDDADQHMGSGILPTVEGELSAASVDWMPTHTDGGREKAASPSISRWSNRRYAFLTSFSRSRPHPSNLAA